MKGIIASLDDIIDKYDNTEESTEVFNDEYTSMFDGIENNNTIERIKSNTGTIITDDNKSFFIADARYRAKKQFRTDVAENPDIRLPMLNNFRQGLFNNYNDEFTSKENTDGIINLYGENALAANYVRSILIPELGYCDLPSFSLFESIIDYIDIIDNLDRSLRFKKYQPYSLRNLFNKTNRYITSTCYSRVSNHGNFVCHEPLPPKVGSFLLHRC